MPESTCSTPGCERATYCKGICQKCYNAAYYAANRERLIEQSGAWHKAHPESVAASRERYKPAEVEYGKTYRAANAPRIKAYLAANYAANKAERKVTQAAYAQAHADEIRVKRAAYYAANPGQVAANSRAWKKANPERASEVSRAGCARRRARMMGAVVTKADYAAILAEHGMVCHICGKPIPDRAHLDFDHVIPIARGGAHSAENIRPSHGSCNRSKGARVPSAA